MFWVLTIFAGACTVIISATLPETYAPIILKRKAERRRKETGDDRWFAPIEMKKESIPRRIQSILAKPFKMIFYEPMLQAVTVYMSVSPRRPCRSARCLARMHIIIDGVGCDSD